MRLCHCRDYKNYGAIIVIPCISCYIWTRHLNNIDRQHLWCYNWNRKFILKTSITEAYRIHYNIICVSVHRIIFTHPKHFTRLSSVSFVRKLCADFEEIIRCLFSLKAFNWTSLLSQIK